MNGIAHSIRSISSSVILLLAISAHAATVWNGPTISFTKSNYANPLPCANSGPSDRKCLDNPRFVSRAVQRKDGKQFHPLRQPRRHGMGQWFSRELCDAQLYELEPLGQRRQSQPVRDGRRPGGPA